MEGSQTVNNDASAESAVKERCLFRVYGLIGSGKTTLLRRTHEVLGGRVPLELVVRPGSAAEQDARYLEGVGLKAHRTSGENLEDDLRGRIWRSCRDWGAVFLEERGTEFSPRLRSEREIRLWIQPVQIGDATPEKYPEFFEGIDLVLLNQIDLLPFTDFSVDRFRRGLRKIRPGVELLGISCRTGVGLEVWRDWFLYRMGFPPVESNLA